MTSTTDRAQPTDRTSTGSAGSKIPLALPTAILLIAAIASTATAWHFPLLPFPVTPADPLMAAAFLLVLYRLWQDKTSIYYPLPVLLFLGIHFVTDIVNTTGVEGGIEVFQKTEYLFFGFIVFAVLIAKGWFRPILWGVWIGLAANVITAYAQIMAHGPGEQVTGLFNSSMTLCLYHALVLCWSLPIWLNVSQKSPWYLRPFPAVLTLIILVTITKAPMLIITLIAVLLIGYLSSLKNGLVTTVPVILVVLAVSFGGTANPWYTSLADTITPVASGQLKETHAEKIAAARMAVDNPWTGVGSNQYQKNINTYFKMLPNPPDPNTKAAYQAQQSGWGILFSTTGLICGFLFVLSMIIAVSTALRSALHAAKPHPLVLGSGIALLVLFAGMLFTDAFIRGIGWYIPLLLAFAFSGVREIAGNVPGGIFLRGSWRAAISLAILYVFLGAGVSATAMIKPAAQQSQSEAVPNETRSSTASEQDESSTTAQQDQQNEEQTYSSDQFPKILNPSNTSRIAAPMRKSEKMENIETTVPALIMPKKTLAGGEDFTPGLQHGGAVYEIDCSESDDYTVWLRAWWADSCGNSVLIRFDNNNPIMTGGDGTYQRWHWVKVPQKVSLGEGRHKLYVLTREDGVRIHQIFLTNNERRIPQGVMKQ